MGTLERTKIGKAVFRKTALRVACSIAALAGTPGGAMAQYSPYPAPQQGFSPAAAPQFAPAAAPQPEQAATVPDDVRVVLMIRNTVLALNQANLTGNYSVLRDMGTPAFQMTNSQARLAEIFASLRARKLDLTPVMVFNPKLQAAPALQDGQVLKLAGFFPTTPEQVHFELAYQHYGEQWLLAGIAVNVLPPGEGSQASAGPAGQLMQSALETSSPQGGKPGDAKPIRIDLSKPAQPKKPAAAKKPKPPAPPAQKTAAAQAPAEQPAAAAPAPAPAQPDPAEAKPAEKSTGFGAGWNPFGR
jgi:hypothetical protein